MEPISIMPCPDCGNVMTELPSEWECPNCGLILAVEGCKGGCTL